MKGDVVSIQRKVIRVILGSFIVGVVIFLMSSTVTYAGKNSEKRWEDLSPQEQKMLMERYEQYRQMPEYQKELLKKRYEQWKSLPPSEREEIKRYLNEWDRLPPEEREAIRKRLKQRF